MSNREAANGTLLQVKNLKKYFPIKSGFLSQISGYVKAVDDVSFFIKSGETLGLVGESGCGKSTLARLILRLVEADAGDVFFDNQNVFQANSKQLRALRREMQIIFQDPYSSLNPRMTIAGIVGEAILYHRLANKKERLARVVYLLQRVGLSADIINRYPHEFSGGQRQRIGIARALALKPKFIIGDEPVSALDVSIQAQIINLLMELQKEFSLAYLIISHDLRVVQHISDRIIVMYLGRIVESAPAVSIYNRPQHPYTEALIAAIPIADPLKKKSRKLLNGDVASVTKLPAGCRFANRCLVKKNACTDVEPFLFETKKDHWVACHLR